MTLFPDLPDEANVWFHCADRQLTTTESAEIRQRLSAFVAQWQSHGRNVIGRVDIISERIIAIAGVIPSGDISGCGIDSVTRELYAIVGEHELAFAPALHVAYSGSMGRIESVSRSDFREIVSNGTHDIDVYDMSVSTLADVRSGRFKVPVSDSWFARYLPAVAN